MKHGLVEDITVAIANINPYFWHVRTTVQLNANLSSPANKRPARFGIFTRVCGYVYRHELSATGNKY